MTFHVNIVLLLENPGPTLLSTTMPGHVVKSTGPDPDPTEFLFISAEQRMLDQTKPYDPKKSCWVPDDKEGFVEGLIQGAKGDKLVSVQLKSGEVKDFKKDLVVQVNPQVRKVRRCVQLDLPQRCFCPVQLEEPLPGQADLQLLRPLLYCH
ncbi:myosin-16-like [Penaeus vannamei]|uniref:myosin-16-like n=1 Tax=Penaeus vannamei TaxID=6689 RepID=UPI00387F7C5D